FLAHNHSRSIAPRCSLVSRRLSLRPASPVDQPKKFTCQRISMAQICHPPELQRPSSNFPAAAVFASSTSTRISLLRLTRRSHFSRVPHPQDSRFEVAASLNWELLRSSIPSAT